MKTFRRVGQSNWYWLAVIAAGLVLESVALYYQYALNEYPCVLCIHIRIWVLAGVLVGVLGLLFRRTGFGLLIASLLSLIVAIGFAERSWQTLAAERGWTTALSCSMASGLPSWFALGRWFPAVFAVQDTCGSTPVLFMTVTMAEMLIVISVIALGVTALVALATFAGNARD